MPAHSAYLTLPQTRRHLTPLSAEIIAIGSAMGWAGDSILVRFGLRQSNIFAAMLVSYTVSITCMWSYLITTTSLDFLRSPAMIYYLISGSMQPLFARALFYEGITRIGVARAGPLRGSEPLFATAIAITIFHEQPGWLVFLGTVLIVGSLWVISGRQQGDTKWRLVDALLPISAGLISAVSQSLRKQGLKIIPDPFVAVAVVTTVSLILLLLFAFTTKRTAQFRHIAAQPGFLRRRGFIGNARAGGELHRARPRSAVRDHTAAQHDAAFHRFLQCDLPAQNRDGKFAHHSRRSAHGCRRFIYYRSLIGLMFGSVVSRK